jgi:hypothetical protein
VINIDGIELQWQGEYILYFVLHPTQTHLSSCDLGCRLHSAGGNECRRVMQQLFWPCLSHLNRKRERTQGKFCICVVSFEETD